MKTYKIVILILIALFFIKVIHHEGFMPGMPGMPGMLGGETPETPDTLTLDKLYIENRSKLLTKIYNLALKPIKGINDINDTKMKWFDDMYPLVNMNLTDKQILILQEGEKELDTLKKYIDKYIPLMKDDDPGKKSLVQLSKEAAPLWACKGSICKSVITLDLNNKKDTTDTKSK